MRKIGATRNAAGNFLRACRLSILWRANWMSSASSAALKRTIKCNCSTKCPKHAKILTISKSNLGRWAMTLNKVKLETKDLSGNLTLLARTFHLPSKRTFNRAKKSTSYGKGARQSKTQTRPLSTPFRTSRPKLSQPRLVYGIRKKWSASAMKTSPVLRIPSVPPKTRLWHSSTTWNS